MIDSVILNLALLMNAPCDVAFIKMVEAIRPTVTAEHVQFAKAACKTNNPDYLWQIAYVESGLDTTVVRVNGTTPTILRENKALSFLETSALDPKANVDIGILQLNWAYHRSWFDSSPTLMRDPQKQVEYVVSKMVTELFNRCGGRWVGCYHSWANKSRATDYQRKVLTAGDKLRSLYAKVGSTGRTSKSGYGSSGNTRGGKSKRAVAAPKGSIMWGVFRRNDEFEAREDK